MMWWRFWLSFDGDVAGLGRSWVVSVGGDVAGSGGGSLGAVIGGDVAGS
jgi:hypothetical protein